MEKFFADFLAVMTGGTIYNIIILVFAIVGIAASFYFYKKSNRHTSATYMVRTIQLINDAVKKLPVIDMLCDGKPVRSLSISKIALWNDGSDTINSDSIAKNNTLRVIIDKRYEILGADIQYEKNPSNDFSISLSEDGHSVKIDFDYFDREEGVVLQLYHTGYHSSDVEVVGQIKACREIRRIKPYSTAPMPMPDFKLMEQIKVNNREFRISNYKAMMLYGWIIVAIASLMLFFGLRDVWVEPIEPVQNDPFMESLWVILFSILYGFVGYQVVKRRVPKGFDIFNDEF
ncbi:MAG: hypothetical protein R3Y16_07460 [Rikenellaceae bacterium]